MARRLPDDPTAALGALKPDDVRRAASDLRSNRDYVAEAQSLARDFDRARDLDHSLERSLGLDLDLALDRVHDLGPPGHRKRSLEDAGEIEGVRDLDDLFDSARAGGLDLDLDHLVDIVRFRGVGLGAALELGLANARDLELVRARDLARDLDRALDVDRFADFGFDSELARAFARTSSPQVRDWLEARAAELDVSPKALCGSLLIQRWWQAVVLAWAISVDEPDIRNRAFSQDEADRARGQLEAVARSWQNIELDPQVVLDPGDEEFIHAQLTTIRSQLILDGIPEIIDRALAALYERFADRADHEGIIRSVLANREPPWSDEDIDCIVGEYQKANDLVAKVSTDDDEVAGAAHTEIKETLGTPIPSQTAVDGGVAGDPAGVEPHSSERSWAKSASKSVARGVVSGVSGAIATASMSSALDLVQSIADSPWLSALWETINALGKSWPFPM